MALQLKNRVRGTTTTTGTGTYTILPAPTGFQDFTEITSPSEVYYVVTDGDDWEVGIGTVTVSGSTTLSRDTVLESSVGGAVNWGAGSKDVAVTMPAQALMSLWYDGTLRHGSFTGTLLAVGALTAQGGMNVAGSIGGTGNAVTGTLTPSISAYGNGMLVVFRPTAANTGAATLSLNGLTARSIVKRNAAALIANDLVTTVPAVLAYDLTNTRWMLLNPQTPPTDVAIVDGTTGTLSVARGGTGATDAGTARTNLGAAATSHTHAAGDITSGTFTDARVASSNVTQHINSILTSLLTVDGAGSGLDADLLDGLSSAHFLAASSYTAADVLSKLLTVDGAGSGLDADLLDGQSSAAFALASHTHDAGDVTSSTFANARISQGSVTQHQAAIDHDALTNFVANEHRLITASTSAPSGGADGDVWLVYTP